MFDWQVSEAEGDGVATGGAAERPWVVGRSRWAWLVALLLLSGAVAGGLRWRVVEQERAMRADLEQVIHQEERARQFGQADVAATWLARDVPDAWREAYLRAIPEPDAPPRPVELTIEEVRFDEGGGALARLTLDGRPEARFYRLEARGWRRAPMPVEWWGAAEQLATARLTLHFRERDRPFAEALAADLPALRTLDTRWPNPDPSDIRHIRIEPFEFGPLVTQERYGLALRSPLLAPSSGLSPEGAARLALARALLTLPDEGTDATAPRNAARLRAAFRDVMALSWALPAAEMDALRARWRAAVEPARWRSAFFHPSTTRAPIDSWEPSEAEATALLTADYLHQSYGTSTLGRVVAASIGSASWDGVLLPLIDRYAAEVDRAVVAHARGDADEAARLREEHVVLALPPGPLHATVAEEPGSGRANVLVHIAGLAEPIKLSGFQAQLFGPDGKPLPTSCLGVYPEMEIEGDWTVPGEAMLVNRATIRRLEPSWRGAAPPPVPPGTQALLVTAEGRTLFALQPDGSLVELLVLEEGWIDPLTAHPARLLFRQEITACQQSWLFLYDSARGIVGGWVVPAQQRTTRVLWHPQEEGPYLFYIIDGNSLAFALDSGQVTPTPVPGRSWPGLPVGWDAHGQPVTVGWEPPSLHILDPTTGEPVGQEPRFLLASPFVPPALTADGRAILLTTRASDGSMAPTRIVRLDLAGGEATTLLETNEIFLPVLGAEPQEGLLLLHAYDLGAQGGQALSLLDIQSGERRPLARVGGQDWIVHALGCGPERVLYSVRQGNSTALYQWTPAAPATLLLQSESPYYPLACP